MPRKNRKHHRGNEMTPQQKENAARLKAMVAPGGKFDSSTVWEAVLSVQRKRP